MKAEQIGRKYDDELRKMKEVTSKTGYETGATICQLGNDEETRHITPVVVGTKNRVVTPGCDFGERKATIHSHQYQPPSQEDLKAGVDEDYTNCIVISDLEINGRAEISGSNRGALVCYEGDKNSNPDKAFRTPESDDDHFKNTDIERMKDAGYHVTVSNL